MGNQTGNILTIIVPIRNKVADFNSMKTWLMEIEKEHLPISVEVIHDGDDSTTWEKILDLSVRFNFKPQQAIVNSPGSARNLGLSRVKTPWLIFWDQDDLGFPAEVISSIKLALESSSAVVGRFKQVETVNKREKISANPNNCLSRLGITPGLWRFALKTDRVSNVLFSSEKMGEDQLFLAQINLSESEVEFSDKIFYSYNVGNSHQLTNTPKAKLELINVILKIAPLLQRKETAKYTYIIFWKLVISEWKQHKMSNLTFAATCRLFLNLPLRAKCVSAKALVYIFYRFSLVRQNV